mmetsp:Transcript_38791/g.115331  ORF Transcript_38791/g.115331 Transcript_38791/m.115331 type:complete len:235 (-) Transcript_38791:714-1418(-)
MPAAHRGAHVHGAPGGRPAGPLRREDAGAPAAGQAGGQRAGDGAGGDGAAGGAAGEDAQCEGQGRRGQAGAGPPRAHAAQLPARGRCSRAAGGRRWLHPLPKLPHQDRQGAPGDAGEVCAGAGGACRGGGWRCCRRGGHGDELTHACELLAEAGFEGPWRVCMSARMSVCMSACLTREPLVVRVQGQFALGVQRTSRTCVGEWRVRLFVRACTCVGGVARPVGELCAASAEITL